MFLWLLDFFQSTDSISQNWSHWLQRWVIFFYVWVYGLFFFLYLQRGTKTLMDLYWFYHKSCYYLLVLGDCFFTIDEVMQSYIFAASFSWQSCFSKRMQRCQNWQSIYRILYWWKNRGFYGCSQSFSSFGKSHISILLISWCYCCWTVGLLFQLSIELIEAATEEEILLLLI